MEVCAAGRASATGAGARKIQAHQARTAANRAMAASAAGTVGDWNDRRMERSMMRVRLGEIEQVWMRLSNVPSDIERRATFDDTGSTRDDVWRFFHFRTGRVNP